MKDNKQDFCNRRRIIYVQSFTSKRRRECEIGHNLLQRLWLGEAVSQRRFTAGEGSEFCMGNVNCQCGKLICQVVDNTLIIKCRHCKRFILIRLNETRTKPVIHFKTS
ncbi:hypothetical protein SAMN02745885_00607 [Carboxydocella sporoproducens DSM 16521]|uniref:Uncharacterized protein n=2 Tax=Carboxydocella TaxID=178898 RepID=A0A1T4MJ88_9FIRM|nr:hypothetical protein CFE_2197 [Carboxydocella thermautotrophica]AVX31783.1 hypothetical protein CTH_2226 [Carboxydocella thermautotrophica]SJZ67109.1 hypothetical protein SAMN02745885_00607 [Carboxydocella sporoproducens DSM 16521]